MKRLIAGFAAVAVIAAAAYAFAAAADVYTYEARNGNVTFEHQAHVDYVGGDCAKCHTDGIGPIDVTKDWAHETCTGCHKEMGAPARCNDCHKK
ncbi:hypothetical protein SAMN05660860_01420 [Geoalkalibacter ferrihydriticus]|uniref:Class III cytochrome C domain-containing protein n=2 Tax=Geoalkalibacter ferrihydriticus TaxID=392333 RepID=A0A0C2HN30_9BACT|nr:cytochrome c3 family protein [Geoalkalibacter ferrihydriticus]KIH76375.1 hypothetical protein GFER_09035 [Geoalkalibacter ferrihydriticus DSM 17813]SDL91467.1 hypothetical protein SAMN05660860_01420 [Geoalkalibacter ferrihydriticus]